MTRSSKKQAGPSSKKAYVPPTLTVYGSVKKITSMAKRRRTTDGAARRT